MDAILTDIWRMQRREENQGAHNACRVVRYKATTISVAFPSRRVAFRNLQGDCSSIIGLHHE